MINVLIKDDNAFFQWALQRLVSELFAREYKKRVKLTLDLNPTTVSQSDMIIVGLRQGEHFTCHPDLRARTKGVIIGLMDKNPVNDVRLPACIADMVYIERRAPIEVIGESIMTAWLRHREAYSSNCYSCRHRALSPQQVRIMAGFYGGKTVSQIANELNVSDKTIFSHKYQVMTKFNVSTDYELMRLLERLHERSLYPHLFIKGMGD